MGIPFVWSDDVAEGLAALLATGGPGAAVFDADGTLWAADAVHAFLAQCGDRLPAHREPVWDANIHCVLHEITPESATRQLALFAGLDLDRAAQWAAETFAERIAPTRYEPVWELARDLVAAGFEIWVCSGSPQWLVEPCVAALIGADRVIATRSGVRAGKLTDAAVEITSGPGKRTAIASRIAGRLRFAAGDSMSDFEMLLSAERALVMAPPDDDGRRGGLPAIARDRGWWVQPVAGTATAEATP